MTRYYNVIFVLFVSSLFSMESFNCYEGRAREFQQRVQEKVEKRYARESSEQKLRLMVESLTVDLKAKEQRKRCIHYFRYPEYQFPNYKEELKELERDITSLNFALYQVQCQLLEEIQKTLPLERLKPLEMSDLCT